MRRREFLSSVMACGLAGGAAASFTGCGTLFHSDRCGQPHSNQIDWKIAAADGLGLMLFFVPGVVAFAVDFYTGAIYLPPAPNNFGAADPSSTPHSVALRRVPVPRHELEPRTIENVVTNHVGRPVPLEQLDARVSPLPRLDHYADQCQRHHSERNFGQSVKGFLQRWQHA